MKHIFKIIFVLSFGLFLMTSCEKDKPDLTYQGEFFIAFDKASSVAKETYSEPLNIVVLLAAGEQSSNVSVDFEIESATAVEGTDYTVLNDSKALVFEKGTYSDTIKIVVNDNSVEDGNKELLIKLANGGAFNLGYPGPDHNNSEYQFTIVDDDCAFKPQSFTGTGNGVEFFPNTEFDFGIAFSLADDDGTTATYELTNMMSGVLGYWADTYGEEVLESWPAVLTVDYTDPYAPVPSLGNSEQYIYHTYDGSDEYHYNVYDQDITMNNISTCEQYMEVYYHMQGYYGTDSFGRDCYFKVSFTDDKKSLRVVDFRMEKVAPKY